jgi:hypothetical protein
MPRRNYKIAANGEHNCIFSQKNRILINFESDEYHTATSKSLKEDENLLKAGFEYVTERDGIKIYRKRK